MTVAVPSSPQARWTATGAASSNDAFYPVAFER